MTSQWQDISTAPLNPAGKANGPYVLAFSRFNHCIYTVRWVASGESGEWRAKDSPGDSMALAKHYITHWMPCPPAPELAS